MSVKIANGHFPITKRPIRNRLVERSVSNCQSGVWAAASGGLITLPGSDDNICPSGTTAVMYYVDKYENLGTIQPQIVSTGKMWIFKDTLTYTQQYCAERSHQTGSGLSCSRYENFYIYQNISKVKCG